MTRWPDYARVWRCDWLVVPLIPIGHHSVDLPMLLCAVSVPLLGHDRISVVYGVLLYFIVQVQFLSELHCYLHISTYTSQLIRPCRSNRCAEDHVNYPNAQRVCPFPYGIPERNPPSASYSCNICVSHFGNIPRNNE